MGSARELTLRGGRARKTLLEGIWMEEAAVQAAGRKRYCESPTAKARGRMRSASPRLARVAPHGFSSHHINMQPPRRPEFLRQQPLRTRN